MVQVILQAELFLNDNASRLTLASSARYSNSVARTYDAASRLTVETLSVGATSYNTGYFYDADNRQTAVVYPSGDVVNRAFTDRNQLQSASFNNVAVANLSYDDGRRLSTKNFGNGTVENRTYRNDNLIASIVTPTVDSFTYTWDANKRKLTQTEAGIPTNDQTYSYDSEDRLTNFARTNGDAQSWNLSLVGDWNNTIINGTQQNRTHNAVHELTAVNATPLTYDVKGNITANSNGQFYSWDVENRLILATDGFNTLATYTYDALGRRTTKTVGANTTVFVSDGLQEIAEYVNGTLTQSYVYGSYIDEPLVMVKADGTKYYYHTNDLYSVGALTDGNGNIVERYKYDPYGKVTVLGADGTTVLSGSSVGNAIGFTGRRLDTETGLMYYRFRNYDVTLGRFISRDPIGYRGGADLYEYGADAPSKYPDPLGLWSGDGHTALTTGACMVAGLCSKCCDIIIAANIAQDAGALDWYFLDVDSDAPEEHSMQTGDISRFTAAAQLLIRKAALANTWKYIAAQVKEGTDSSKAGSCDLALAAFGRGLHALQDKYAHQGWAGTPGAGLPVTDAEHRADLTYDDSTKVPSRYRDAAGASQRYIAHVAIVMGCCCSQPKYKDQPVRASLCGAGVPPDKSCVETPIVPVAPITSTCPNSSSGSEYTGPHKSPGEQWTDWANPMKDM